MDPMFKNESRSKAVHIRTMIIAGIVLVVSGFFVGFFAAGQSAPVMRIIGQGDQQPEGGDLSPVWKAWP